MKIIFLELTLILLFSFAQAQESDKKQTDNHAEQQRKKNNEPKNTPAVDAFEPSEKVLEDHPVAFPADI